jgi:hypothetical protein
VDRFGATTRVYKVMGVVVSLRGRKLFYLSVPRTVAPFVARRIEITRCFLEPLFHMDGQYRTTHRFSSTALEVA